MDGIMKFPSSFGSCQIRAIFLSGLCFHGNHERLRWPLAFLTVKSTMPPQYIHIHAGEFGTDLGRECWELYCEEHDIDKSGSLLTPEPKSSGIHSFFYQSSSHTYKPRAVFLDTDNFNRLRFESGECRSLFKKKNVRILENVDIESFKEYEIECLSDKNWDDVEFVRSEVERADQLAGFIIMNSAHTLKGSVCGGRAITELDCIYPKRMRIAFTEYPTKLASGLMAIYAALYQIGPGKFPHCTFCLDEDAIGNFYRNSHKVQSPKFPHGFKLIAQAISALTMCERLIPSKSGSLYRFEDSLQLTNELRYPVIMIGLHNQPPLNTWDLTRKAFQPMNCLCSIDITKGNVLGSNYYYKGIANGKSVKDDFNKLRSMPQYERFVKKASLNLEYMKNPPKINPRFHDFVNIQSCVSVACHTTAIRQLWESISRNFTILRNRNLLSTLFHQNDIVSFPEIAQELAELSRQYKLCELDMGAQKNGNVNGA